MSPAFVHDATWFLAGAVVGEFLMLAGVLIGYALWRRACAWRRPL